MPMNSWRGLSIDSHWTLARLMVRHCPMVLYRGEWICPADRTFTYWMSQARRDLARLLVSFGEPDVSGVRAHAAVGVRSGGGQRD